MKHKPYSIRHATLSDVSALARIQYECFGDEFLESEQSYRSKLESNPQTCFIAEHDDTVCSYIIGLAVDEHSFPILNAPSIITPDNSIEHGLALFCPAISGAVPCVASNMA